ncbi:MAG: hypothetical protein LPJ87_08705 [Zoogloeaceae bacterium]|nr:hypothetical protein [Zoogloeaceae bacterium]
MAHFSAVDSAGAALDPWEIKIALFEEAETCRKRSLIHGARNQPPLSTSFVPIQAGGPVSMAFYFHREEPVSLLMMRMHGCRSIIQFDAKPGLFYQARLAASHLRCEVTLQSAESPNMSGAVEVPFTIRRSTTPFNENSSFCER